MIKSLSNVVKSHSQINGVNNNGLSITAFNIFLFVIVEVVDIIKRIAVYLFVLLFRCPPHTPTTDIYCIETRVFGPDKFYPECCEYAIGCA